MATRGHDTRTDQEKDPEVQRWMQQEDPTQIVRKGGVLCRVWTIPQELSTSRLSYQNSTVAHDIPLSGHLGRDSTYWPTLFRDVKQHCQTCEECQLHGAKACDWRTIQTDSHGYCWTVTEDRTRKSVYTCRQLLAILRRYLYGTLRLLRFWLNCSLVMGYLTYRPRNKLYV